jgi:hypothetical protein
MKNGRFLLNLLVRIFIILIRYLQWPSRVAQPAERVAVNHQVGGSSPSPGASESHRVQCGAEQDPLRYIDSPELRYVQG